MLCSALCVQGLHSVIVAKPAVNILQTFEPDRVNNWQKYDITLASVASISMSLRSSRLVRNSSITLQESIIRPMCAGYFRSVFYACFLAGA